MLETLDPMLSHALDLNDKPEQNAQQSESGRNVETLFDEVTEPEERPLSKRERKEEERRAKEARKQAAREAREKEKKGPSFIDMLFSDNNNA